MKVIAVLCLCLGAAVGAFHEPEEMSCEGAPDSGMCLAYMPMFYYDAETDTCKKFIYGGCQGNGNRYWSEERCLEKCKAKREVSKDICSLEPESGRCLAYIPKYYFDAKSGQCKHFIYGGCQGNENRFNTVEECNTACNVNRQVAKDVCSLEPETGLCEALFYKYYFDAKSGKCKVFVYGGCGGNDNKFNTIEECNAVCKVARSELNNCLDEPETGMCRGYFPKYYYDARSGKCMEFIYGGCGGNGNNYSSEEECLNACH